MKTDSIFYTIFQSLPGIFFELIDRNPSEASAYEFKSIEVKQVSFRLDGLFSPTSDDATQPKGKGKGKGKGENTNPLPLPLPLPLC